MKNFHVKYVVHAGPLVPQHTMVSVSEGSHGLGHVLVDLGAIVNLRQQPGGHHFPVPHVSAEKRTM